MNGETTINHILKMIKIDADIENKNNRTRYIV